MFSNMTPKLRAESTGNRVTSLSRLVSFKSHCGRPRSRNLVLEVLIGRKLGLDDT
jgi:hypothetical protein